MEQRKVQEETFKKHIVVDSLLSSQLTSQLVLTIAIRSGIQDHIIGFGDHFS
jgi:hypothetical protein